MSIYPNFSDNIGYIERLDQQIGLAEDNVTPTLSELFGGMIGSIDIGLGVCGWVGSELTKSLNDLISAANRRVNNVQKKIAQQVAEYRQEAENQAYLGISVGEPCAKPLDGKVVITDDCPPGTPGLCDEFPIMCDPGIPFPDDPPPGDGPPPGDAPPPCPGGVCPKPEPEPDPNPRFICRFDPKTGKRILFDPIGFICKDEETGAIIDCPPNIGSLEDCPPKKPKPDDSKCCPPSPINIDIGIPEPPPPVVITQPILIPDDPPVPEHCTDDSGCHFRPAQDDVSYYGVVQVPDSNCHNETIYSDCGKRIVRLGISRYINAQQFRQMIESEGVNAGFDWAGGKKAELEISISNGIPNDE